MSMNLCFDVKGAPAIVDFPFQTPTDLTYAVLEEEDPEKRLILIETQLIEWGFNEEELAYKMAEVKALMDSPNLKLTMI